jgi:hypothetical protein
MPERAVAKLLSSFLRAATKRPAHSLPCIGSAVVKTWTTSVEAPYVRSNPMLSSRGRPRA